jgi:dihydroorotate dehydrogenase electron transfer subunit
MVIEKNARIVQKESWGDYHLFSLEAASIARAAKPGQFMMVKIQSQFCPLLRRPFGIHGRTNDAVEIFFKVAGHGTALLAAKKTGEMLDILGPLGKGFGLEDALPGKTIWAVAGGRGIAPFKLWAEEARSRGARLKILYGGRTRADLPIADRFRQAGFETACSTDDGSIGFKGFVSELLEAEIRKARPDGLYACGPDPMMAAVSRIALGENIPCRLSLESQMGCGFGACWGCVKKIRRAGSEDWVKICEEGPVFKAGEIVWEEETP